VHLFEIGSNFF